MKKNLLFCLVSCCTIFGMDKRKPTPPDPPSGGSDSESFGSDSDDGNTEKKSDAEQLIETYKILKAEVVDLRGQVNQINHLLITQALEQIKILQNNPSAQAETEPLLSLTPRESNSTISNVPQLTLLKPLRMPNSPPKTNDD